MTRRAKFIAATALTAALLTGGMTVARAQAVGPIAAAIDAGAVGEQADGYLGIRSAISPALRSEVEALNIKRRAGYTKLAEQRGVTVKDVAAAVGCQTLATRVGVGDSYLLPDGVWRKRADGEAIKLPGYCAT